MQEEKVQLALMVPLSAKDELYALAANLNANFPGITVGDVLGKLIAVAVRREDVLSALAEEFGDQEDRQMEQRKKRDAERKRVERAKKPRLDRQTE
jgi:hypothetical protein